MANRYITSPEQLLKELNKLVNAAMKDVAKDAVKVVKAHLQSEVYDSEPAYYRRTNQLKSSVSSDVYQIGTITQAKIFHDTNKMKAIAPNYGNNRMEQHHSSVRNYQPQDFRPSVANAVNDGTSGLIFGEGYWTRPRPYFTLAKAEIESRFVNNLKYGLVFRGLTLQ